MNLSSPKWSKSIRRVETPAPVMRPSDRLVAAEFAGNRSILSGSVATMVRPCCPERSFKTRAFGAVMKVKPMGMLWMMPAGWSDHLARADRWAQKGLPEGRLVARMRKFTLLDDAVRGFRAVPAEGWVGEAGRRQRLVGIHDPGGERRRLFGVGEGPAEGVAEAKQYSRAMPELCVNFVSVATSKSLQAPLVTYLSTT